MQKTYTIIYKHIDTHWSRSVDTLSQLEISNCIN